MMDKRNNKKRYHELKAAGICTQCKRTKAIKDRVKCGPCMYDDREDRRAKREINKNKGETSMIIILEDEIYKNKSNEEVLRIIADVFENKFNHPGISVIYDADNSYCGDKYYRKFKKLFKGTEFENNKKYEELKEKARILDCLNEMGVDNWTLYPDAMALLDQDDEKDDTELDDELEYIIEKGD